MKLQAVCTNKNGHAGKRECFPRYRISLILDNKRKKKESNDPYQEHFSWCLKGLTWYVIINLNKTDKVIKKKEKSRI